eukprot:1161445-Pelagomonas_calceolata.AAC.4
MARLRAVEVWRPGFASSPSLGSAHKLMASTFNPALAHTSAPPAASRPPSSLATSGSAPPAQSPPGPIGQDIGLWAFLQSLVIPCPGPASCPALRLLRGEWGASRVCSQSLPGCSRSRASAHSTMARPCALSCSRSASTCRAAGMGGQLVGAVVEGWCRSLGTGHATLHVTSRQAGGQRSQFTGKVEKAVYRQKQRSQHRHKTGVDSRGKSTNPQFWIANTEWCSVKVI